MNELSLEVPQRRRGTPRTRGRATPSSHLCSSLIGMDCPEKGGKAVYAREAIVRDTMLVVWGGTVVTFEGIRERPLSDRRLTLQVDDDAYLVSEVEGPADWVNHSCDPNAGMRGQITLVAMRDIRAGEEICFDYAMSDLTDYDEFDCYCRTATCRGRVSGSDWMRPELRARYAGYFAPHVERRIRSVRVSRPIRSMRARRAG